MTISATTETEKNTNFEEYLASLIFNAVDRMTTEMIFDWEKCLYFNDIVCFHTDFTSIVLLWKAIWSDSQFILWFLINSAVIASSICFLSMYFPLYLFVCKTNYQAYCHKAYWAFVLWLVALHLKVWLPFCLFDLNVFKTKRMRACIS